MLKEIEMTEQECIVKAIQDEIYRLEKYKYNLKKTAYLSCKQNDISSKNFYNILDEVERLVLEIQNLERQKTIELNKNIYQ